MCSVLAFVATGTQVPFSGGTVDGGRRRRWNGAVLRGWCFPGGTLRIYADSLKPNIPYKTILLSTTDPADFAVAEALEKYGLEKESPRDYCIARVSPCRAVLAGPDPGRRLPCEWDGGL